ncbi:MAG: YCF48-related protein [Georgfuchsia sp.]
MSRILLLRLIAFTLWFAHSLGANAYQDPLDQPSTPSQLASSAPLFSVARAGTRIVALGRHGIIVFSDSNGKEWQQATVPVSTDLTALSFPNAKEGWAVGHGAVVLHSIDGGATWVKQLDGRSFDTLVPKYYESSAAILNADEAVQFMVRRIGEEKDAEPFLDVWFQNDKTGFVSGTFNRLFRTDDGGEHWIPLFEKVDNPEELHLYAVRGLGSEVFLAGERGMVWRWDESKERFILIPTPYSGSLFGLVVTSRAVLAFGMKGNLFRTLDRGSHWENIPTGLQSGIVAGDIRANGDIVLASESGELITSSDEGATFQPIVLSRRGITSSFVSTSGDTFALTGPKGVRTDAPATTSSVKR